MQEASAEQGLTVVGNLAVDRVDGRPPSPGGCPSFAATAFTYVGRPGRILTKRAMGDASLFDGALDAPGVFTTVLDAAATSAFELAYHGEQRTMTVVTVGDPWTPEGLVAVDIDTTWVHAAPLLRDEFPIEALAALRGAGHSISFDGQGLVRVPRVGVMTTNAAYDPGILEYLTALKLADDEAEIVAGGKFTSVHAARLAVPEILVTFGSAGADLYLDGALTHVAPEHRVEGVHTTGSGDMFAVAYAAARAAGTEPLPSAQAACELVADVLERRRAGAAI